MAIRSVHERNLASRDMTRLWIVRHGNTFAPGELPRRIGARTDLPLVESGRVQARALADWFACQGIIFNRVLSSPLRRTLETAETIAHDVMIEIADWLAEIDHGPDENQTEAMVAARIGEEAIAAWDREGVAPNGWVIDIEARLAGWRALLAGTRPVDRILLVTSNGAARFALAADTAVAQAAAALPHRRLRTGAFGILARPAMGSWQIEVWDERPR